MSTPLQEREDRLRKLEAIKEMGVHPYPERFSKTHMTSDLKKLDASFDKDLEELKEKKPETYTLAGRMTMYRAHGKLSFAHLLDEDGKIQLAIMQDVIGKDQYKFVQKKLDIGDFIGVSGDLFVTKHGERTLLVTSLTFLGKALRPLPEKWHGLKDREKLYRQRYLDLISNQETMERFKMRSKFVKSLREFYWKEGFYEVETSTLMHTATGAAAAPYETHNNALDLDVVLRISHELPLKTLIVGGFEKVFEIGKVFRNEGADPSHLPEHTHVEHYAAYWNFEDNIKFTERMFDHLFEALGLPKEIPFMDREGNKKIIDFSTPWARIDYVELFKKDGVDILTITLDEAKQMAKDKGLRIEGIDHMGLTTVIDHIYKKLYRPHIINPSIVYNYPLQMQPLARQNDEDPRLVDQFQLVINTWEVLKAYSELVDPLEQRARFVDQAEAKAAGDEEAMDMEEDYLLAMEYGMPPISGWGMGIDRIVTLLAGQDNLRDMVFFPLMKPESKA